jgi:hypothetical protein
MNAIAIERIHHTWVRDVEIVNSDLGVRSDQCAYQTITGLKLRNSESRCALVMQPSRVGRTRDCLQAVVLLLRRSGSTSSLEQTRLVLSVHRSARRPH